MNILLTAMSLGIGGAETHIVELAGELARRGHRVVVASNGGVYVEKLEKAGVRHVTLPLHRKNPAGLCRAYRGLLKLIREEEIEVIHAHARIPAFLSHLASKKTGIPFVATCHGQYQTGPLWRAVSHWGEYTLAVSPDIKEYLIDEYSLFPDNIGITVNAIDGEKFRPGEEKRERHSILYVSRIDRAAALTGFQLVAAAEKLAAEYPDFSLDMVGDGNAFAELKKKAAIVNRKLGRECVTLYGARTDVEKFMKAGGLFVGVSRSCLEAMASGMQVIVSGAEGHIGRLTEKNLPEALATNFCCRGLGIAGEEALIGEIRKAFAAGETEALAEGRRNREIVLSHYSIDRMACDADRLYRRVKKEKPSGRRVLVSGYYGFGNMGDDSLLQVIVRDLRSLDPGIAITVISNNPKQTSSIYHVNSIRRFDLIALKKEQKKGGLLLSGGGSLLTDVTSIRSTAYYSYIMLSSKKAGMKVMLYANGIGPLIREKARKMAKAALNAADLITLREPSSLKELAELGIGGERVTVTGDPAFGLIPEQGDWSEYRMRRSGIKAEKGFFAVSVRSWQESVSGFAGKLADACREIAGKYDLTPVLLPMQASKDRKLCEEVASLSGGVVLEGLCAGEVVSLLSSAEFVIGMRLHSLIYTFSAGRPLIGLSYDPKIDALLASLDYPYRLAVSEFESETLVDYADEVMRNREKLAADVSSALTDLRRRAVQNASLAIGLMGDSRRE